MSANRGNRKEFRIGRADEQERNSYHGRGNYHHSHFDSYFVVCKTWKCICHIDDDNDFVVGRIRIRR